MLSAHELGIIERGTLWRPSRSYSRGEKNGQRGNFKLTFLKPFYPVTMSLLVSLTEIFPDGNMKCCRLYVFHNYTLDGGVIFFIMPKWRNWQTRYIQGVVPVREWRFESSLRHHQKGQQKPKPHQANDNLRRVFTAQQHRNSGGGRPAQPK